MKEQLEALRGTSVCIHTFSHPGMRGELFVFDWRYFILFENVWREVKPEQVQVIEEDHIYIKGFNGQ